LNIDWKLDGVKPIVSDRDAHLPLLKEITHG